MPFKILLVDDDIENETNEISKLPGMLEAAGYEVMVTSEASRAYDLVWDFNPDLIIYEVTERRLRCYTAAEIEVSAKLFRATKK